MPCCLVTGEAAGMAAAHAIKQTRNDVHKIGYFLFEEKIERGRTTDFCNIGMLFHNL